MRWFALLLLVLSTPISLPAQDATVPLKRALLIGINQYQPPGTTAQHPGGCQGGRCDLPTFKNLDGALNDVVAMRDLLHSPKFGFEASNIVTLTNPDLASTQLPFVRLPAAQTTHDGLLSVMQKFLVDLPNAGDMVVFYYAGHGSLRVNSQGAKLAMLVNGRPSHADSTLVPSDAWTGGYDIRDREMTHIFQAAVEKGIHLTVLLDSCHSGSFTRGVEMGKQVKERSLEYDPRDVNEGPELMDGKPVAGPTQRGNYPALVFSAAQQDETAKELTPDSAGDEAAHGVFTTALLQALTTLPADAPAADVYRRVLATMEGAGVADQMPAMDAGSKRLALPLFGGSTLGQAKLTAAVIGVGNEGAVRLDVGQVSGIAPGSEFVTKDAGSNAKALRIRVDSVDGLTESKGTVISPSGAQAQVSELFVLDKWVPDPVNRLHFWLWPTQLSLAEVTAAAQQVIASGFTPVQDPVEQSWTDMLTWNGAQWLLRRAAHTTDVPIPSPLTAAGVKTALSQERTACLSDTPHGAYAQVFNSVTGLALLAKVGAQKCTAVLFKSANGWIVRHIREAVDTPLGLHLKAEALKQHLDRDSKLWANLPPPRELAEKLSLNESNSLVAGVSDVAKADYVLVGSMSNGAPHWAWFHKTEYDAGPRAEVTHDHSAGCSTHFGYPVATDWVLLDGSDSLSEASSTLDKYAVRLAKVNGWLHLVGGTDDASTEDYYKLVFKRLDDKSVLPENLPAKEDDRLRMFLTSSEPIVQKRWVYVLDIDCHGTGTLLYPIDTADNRFPNMADSPKEIELPGAPTLRIGPPFGVDTILMISTQEPLSDPYELNFEGVSSRGSSTRGVQSPLQQLLSGASAGTRGEPPYVPTDWSIYPIKLQSVPKDSQK